MITPLDERYILTGLTIEKHHCILTMFYFNVVRLKNSCDKILVILISRYYYNHSFVLYKLINIQNHQILIDYNRLENRKLMDFLKQLKVLVWQLSKSIFRLDQITTELIT